MSALPKAVQKQVEEANRLAEQLAQERQSQTQPPPGDTPVPDPGAPPDPAAQPPADGGPPPSPAPAEGWEHKYRVLQGKYNAEVPRLQHQVSEQSTVIEQLKQQMTATQGMLSAFAQNRVPAPGGQSSAPAAATRLVKDEEVKEFGEDLTDFIKRVAQDAILPAVEQRLQPVQKQFDEMRGISEEDRRRAIQAAHEQFVATLDKELPDWRQQNNDPLFLEWLAQPDSYSGVARKTLIMQAHEGFDAPRVIAFFKGYRNENAVVTPPNGAAAPAPQPGASQRSLDDFVAPGAPKPGTTSAPNGAGKRTWTQAEIQHFYTEAAAGKFRNNKQRRDEIEREIHAAAREGRVR